jgi:hypothetical protein
MSPSRLLTNPKVVMVEKGIEIGIRGLKLLGKKQVIIMAL